MAKKKVSSGSSRVAWVINGDSKNTTRQIRNVLSASKNFHERLHFAARNAMVQVLVHSQSTPLVELINGLDRSSIHVKGLIDWAIKHGNGITMSVNKDKGGVKVTFPKPYDNLKLEDAINWALEVKSFWEENPPPSAFKGFNYAEELAKLNKRADEMARALAQGTIERKGEIIELTDADKAKINLKGYRSESAVLH
jgi:hypothetical protein